MNTKNKRKGHKGNAPKSKRGEVCRFGCVSFVKEEKDLTVMDYILNKISHEDFTKVGNLVRENPSLDYTAAVGLLIRAGQIELIKLIIDEVHCKVQDIDYLIEIAGNFGHLDIIKYLHEKGANIKNCFKFIWIICSFQYWDVINYLVENGASISELSEADRQSFETWKASQN